MLEAQKIGSLCALGSPCSHCWWSPVAVCGQSCRESCRSMLISCRLVQWSKLCAVNLPPRLPTMTSSVCGSTLVAAPASSYLVCFLAGLIFGILLMACLFVCVYRLTRMSTSLGEDSDVRTTATRRHHQKIWYNQFGVCFHTHQDCKGLNENRNTKYAILSRRACSICLSHDF